jgi:polar amino acid transport system substrate-binding protein
MSVLPWGIYPVPSPRSDMLKLLSSVLAVLAVTTAAQASSQDFTMVAPMSQSMPLVQFEKGKLSGGILRDLGIALSRRLGRTPQFINVSADGSAAVLADGRADGLCFVLPTWLDGDFNWTVPFMSDNEMVVSRVGARPIRSLTDLRNRPVGAVHSYRYPRIDQVLGEQFRRADYQTIDENIRKLLDGAVQHALLSKSAVEYHNFIRKAAPLRIDLTIAAFEAQCAFSKKSEIAFADIDRAFNMMIKDGTIERIIARYR